MYNILLIHHNYPTVVKERIFPRICLAVCEHAVYGGVSEQLNVQWIFYISRMSILVVFRTVTWKLVEVRFLSVRVRY